MLLSAHVGTHIAHFQTYRAPVHTNRKLAEHSAGRYICVCFRCGSRVQLCDDARRPNGDAQYAVRL